MTFSTYTGGYFLTNAYALDLPGDGAASGAADCLLVDAPEGVADWLGKHGRRVRALLLTHAHIDHVQDAARVTREHGCPVFHHADGLPLLTDVEAYRRFGLPLEIEPVVGGTLTDETPRAEFVGLPLRVLLVPGHCPGSLCFFHEASRNLFAGDTLFAGSVGRWDLPGGDRDLLLTGIREKLLTLGDDVRVLPGHGPVTTVGIERAENPYVQPGFVP